MRALAGGLLALSALGFILTSLAPPGWIWTGYARAFCEAATVGACADWFAVTALFRRPLGLPIPHTAIIPRNKARIGEALGDFIANNFLTPRVLDQRLRAIEPARRLADWLLAPGTAEGVAGRVADFLPDVVGAAPELRALAADTARRAVMDAPAAPLAGRLVALAWNEGQARGLIERGAARLAGWLEGHKDFIAERIRADAWKWLPKWLDKILVERLVTSGLRALGEMADPEHPWRADLAVWVEGWREKLEHDPATRAAGEALKARLLADPALARALGSIWDDLEARWSADVAGRRDALARALTRGLQAAGRWLRDDPAARGRLDGWARVVLRRTLAPRRAEIGRFVAQVVDSWDAREVVDRLELQVGKDLQYIRINGTLVGGLVGLAIHALTRLAGWPAGG